MQNSQKCSNIKIFWWKWKKSPRIFVQKWQYKCSNESQWRNLVQFALASRPVQNLTVQGTVIFLLSRTLSTYLSHGSLDIKTWTKISWIRYMLGKNWSKCWCLSSKKKTHFSNFYRWWRFSTLQLSKWIIWYWEMFN